MFYKKAGILASTVLLIVGMTGCSSGAKPVQVNEDVKAVVANKGEFMGTQLTDSKSKISVFIKGEEKLTKASPEFSAILDFLKLSFKQSQEESLLKDGEGVTSCADYMDTFKDDEKEILKEFPKEKTCYALNNLSPRFIFTNGKPIKVNYGDEVGTLVNRDDIKGLDDKSTIFVDFKDVVVDKKKTNNIPVFGEVPNVKNIEGGLYFKTGVKLKSGKTLFKVVRINLHDLDGLTKNGSPDKGIIKKGVERLSKPNNEAVYFIK